MFAIIFEDSSLTSKDIVSEFDTLEYALEALDILLESNMYDGEELSVYEMNKIEVEALE